jgi:hypothetical protein
MQLYYAMGGGMGHLSRAAAFIYTQKIADADIILLTSSAYAADILPNIKCLHISHKLPQTPQILAAKINEIISDYKISLCYIDAFPTGIVGEWAQVDTKRLQLHYIARLLNWEAYRPFWSESILFEQIYICEPLTAAHENDLRRVSANFSNLDLAYPPALGFDLREKFNINKFDTQKPIWLIVHSENQAEIQALYDYAKDVAAYEKISCHFILITAAEAFDVGGQADWLKHSAAYAFFSQAAKIFTAAGFNLMQQLRDFRARHHILPFRRTFDNQFLRLKRWKSDK